ncbi:MAG: CDP-diacylglycerol--glycerol-3-phosphate 3-phosphatidyltransferase, partial [Planctomycetota bacterium]
MTVPNLLTFLRFFLAPVFLLVYLGSGHGAFLEPILSARAAYIVCLVVVLLSEVSDLLDGYLARRLGQVSNLGKILDPYADSTFHLTCFFAFTTNAHGGWIPLWAVMVLFYREVLIHVVRKLGVERSTFIAARVSGKFKTFCQANTVILLLVYALVFYGPKEGGGLPAPGMETLANILVGIVVGVTLFS